MIGMMYLVLTALLALNISKEVLNGFVKVERGLIQTQSTLKEKSLQSFHEIDARYNVNPVKVEPFFTAAKEVKRASEELRKYMQELKARTIATSQGVIEEAEANNMAPYLQLDEEGFPMCIPLDFKNPEDSDKPLEDQAVLISKPDEYDAVTNMLYGAEIGAPKEGAWTAVELRTKLEAYRDALTAITFQDANGNDITMPPGLVESINKRFQFPVEFEDGKEVSWEYANFYHNPLAAVMPIMSKLIIDVQDAEHDVLAFLLSGIDGKSFKVNKFVPLVVPESNYVLRGDSIRAKVMLAAFDNTNIPNMYLSSTPWNGDTTAVFDYSSEPLLAVNQSTGFGEYRASTRSLSLGEHQFQGTVLFKDGSGNTTAYPVLTDPITVAEPALVVSPTKMNVFYRGVPNPVEISVPGVPQDKIEVRIDGGHSLKKQSDGTYVVEPSSNSSVREANITVTAELPDGSKKSLPAKNFRVKRIPDPVAFWTGKTPTDKGITKAEVMSFAPVAARMEGFDFDVQVRVKSFTMKISKDGQFSDLPSPNNRITPDMQAAMSKLRRGNILYLEDILVSMPDGSTRDLPPMKLRITG